MLTKRTSQTLSVVPPNNTTIGSDLLVLLISDPNRSTSWVVRSAHSRNWFAARKSTKAVIFKHQMDRESQSLAVNYIILVVLLCILWILYMNVSRQKFEIMNGNYLNCSEFHTSNTSMSLKPDSRKRLWTGTLWVMGWADCEAGDCEFCPGWWN